MTGLEVQGHTQRSFPSCTVLISDLRSSSRLSLAAARVQSAEEVRPRRAEGPTAHAQTLRTRAHGRPQESGADPASGTTVKNVLLLFYFIVVVFSVRLM